MPPTSTPVARTGVRGSSGTAQSRPVRPQASPGPVAWAVRVSIAVVLAAIGIGVVAPTVLAEHQLIVLAVGFAVGLPHGAVDHLVPFWHGWLASAPSTMAVVLLGYVAAAVVTWVGLHWAGPLVLPVLLLVSVVHFGAGDLMADRDSGLERDPGSRWTLGFAVVARGGPLVAVPLLVWPTTAAQSLIAVGNGFVMPALWVRVVLAAVVMGCVLVTIVSSVRRRQYRAAVEVAVLTALFVVVPPLAAFGIYFGAWHGLRHTARLIFSDPRSQVDLAAGRLLRPLRRFAVSAAVPTLVSGGTAVALVVAGQHTGLAGPVFALLLALTVPHLLVVAGLDVACLRRPTLLAMSP